jgi:hypothetical protein
MNNKRMLANDATVRMKDLLFQVLAARYTEAGARFAEALREP